MLAPLLTHRGYIWRNALAEVRNRYAGSMMGLVWNVLEPLSLILIFTIVFTRIMSDRGAGLALEVPYVVYLCSALLPWTAFCEGITHTTHTFTANANYLRKLALPEHVFVAQSALTTLFGLAVSFTLLVVISLALGVQPSWRWALLPAPLLLLVTFAAGIGMGLGTLHVFFRDVGHMVPIFLRIGFWLYPIVYHAEGFLGPGAARFLPLNPAYPFLESVRVLFIRDEIPGPWLWAGMAAWTLVGVSLGFAILRRLRSEMRDVL